MEMSSTGQGEKKEEVITDKAVEGETGCVWRRPMQSYTVITHEFARVWSGADEPDSDSLLTC